MILSISVYNLNINFLILYVINMSIVVYNLNHNAYFYFLSFFCYYQFNSNLVSMTRISKLGTHVNYDELWICLMGEKKSGGFGSLNLGSLNLRSLPSINNDSPPPLRKVVSEFLNTVLILSSWGCNMQETMKLFKIIDSESILLWFWKDFIR